MTTRNTGLYAFILSMALLMQACSDSASQQSKQTSAVETRVGDDSAKPTKPPMDPAPANGPGSSTSAVVPGKPEEEKVPAGQPESGEGAAAPDKSKESKESTPPPAATATSSTYGSGGKPAAADRKALSWYYMKKPKGQVPNFPNETKSFTKDMKALYVGTGKKVYLTIDTGGPLGDTDLLLKSLRDNHAKANFFIAGYNVKKAPDFVRQLVEDGHLVANHTMTHTDMNKQTDEQVKKEIHDYEKLYKEVTGKEIQPYFRFPYGSYNMHLLQMVSEMGYTSVFWSTAMRDWEPRKNGADDPYNDIMNNLHDGNIILMHQGSEENIEALDRIIKGVREAGYEFALLSDIKPSAK